MIVEFASRGWGKRSYERRADGRVYETSERHGTTVRRPMSAAAWTQLVDMVDLAAGDRVTR